LKYSLTLPFAEVLPKSVKFIQGTVERISQSEKYVLVDGLRISFDYLVVGLGSVTDYFGIPGAAENSIPMKSVVDALKIRNASEFLVQSHRQDVVKKLLRIVIAGGGFTGVELAGELSNLIEILSWKYNYPIQKIQIEIIEGSGQLLPGMPVVIGGSVRQRLQRFGVSLIFNSMITKVSPTQLTLNSGEAINYDLLVWCAGVKAAELDLEAAVKQDRKGRCPTCTDLTMLGYENIFLIGDNAAVMDSQNNPMPQTATQAIMQADYVVEALIARLKGNTTPDFVPRPSPYIIPVRGKWAVMHLANGFTMIGFIPWLAKIIATAAYFARLMPLHRAIQLAWFETKLYTRND